MFPQFQVVSLSTTDTSPKVKSPVKRRHRMKTVKPSPKRLFKSPRKIQLEATSSLACQTDSPDYSDFQQQFPEPVIESREKSQSTDHAYYVPIDQEECPEQRILPNELLTSVEPDKGDSDDDNSGSGLYDFDNSSSSEQDSSQTYDPSSSSSGNQEEIPATLEQTYLYQSKFLVFIEHLEHLFYLISCPECGLKTTHVEDHVSGSLLSAKLYCPNYHLILDWKSQPVIEKVGLEIC
ncbi:hypothetical protein BSL78_24566 [Apostichopus japonicus]|uniref:Uncharacterized protein n=1 Tax=Stichopus japonicus TaxID=307972 RepID=A0A2G8JS44_STIJA|nr:hypothetical protein BSL78_24566 [Apostichopus japonicus]